MTTAAAASPASAGSAAVTEVAGTAQPRSTSHHHGSLGACAPGERWVYVSPTPDVSYNPLAMTTRSLGAKSLVSPSSKGDAFDDGVTVRINGSSISYAVNEAVDPNTIVTISRVVVDAGDHFTVYRGAAALPDTPLTSPAHSGSSVSGISHGYLCYSCSGAPPVTPEVPYAIALPLVGLAAGALVLRKRRRAHSLS